MSGNIDLEDLDDRLTFTLPENLLTFMQNSN